MSTAKGEASLSTYPSYLEIFILLYIPIISYFGRLIVGMVAISVVDENSIFQVGKAALGHFMTPLSGVYHRTGVTHSCPVTLKVILKKGAKNCGVYDSTTPNNFPPY